MRTSINRNRSARRSITPLAMLALIGPLLLLGPGAARADIASDIATAKARLAALQDQTEQISEAYNAAQIRFTEAQRRATSARNAATVAQHKVATQQQAVRSLARTMYMGAGQGTFTSFVAAGDPGAFLDQASTLNQISANRARAVDAFKAAAKTSGDAERAAANAERDARAQAEVANRKRNDILAAVSQQTALLDRLQTEQAQLVAQAQAALAKAAADRRAAAAQQLAQAQADQQALANEAAATASSAPASAAASTPAPKPTTTPDPPPPSGDTVSVAIAWARREMGKPYVYGAAGPDTFDCSGLTMYVYGKAGISLPHYTGSQWNAGRHVSRDQLQPGDLVFFYSDLHHVGLYIGGGQMIDAPHSGAYVEQVPVWWDLYQGAVRVA